MAANDSMILHDWKNYTYTGAEVIRIASNLDCLKFVRDGTSQTTVSEVCRIFEDKNIVHKLQFRNVPNNSPINFSYYLDGGQHDDYLLSVSIVRISSEPYWEACIYYKNSNITKKFNADILNSLNVLIINFSLCLTRNVFSLMINGNNFTVKLGDDTLFTVNTSPTLLNIPHTPPIARVRHTSPKLNMHDNLVSLINKLTLLQSGVNEHCIKFIIHTSGIGIYFYDCR